MQPESVSNKVQAKQIVKVKNFLISLFVYLKTTFCRFDATNTDANEGGNLHFIQLGSYFQQYKNSLTIHASNWSIITVIRLLIRENFIAGNRRRCRSS